VSGLAQAYELSDSQQYLAGLWKCNIEQQLCWTVNQGSRYDGYRAPTWSWAALDGEVDFQDVHSRIGNRFAAISTTMMHVRLERAVYEPVDPQQPYGAIRGANLRILCGELLVGPTTTHLKLKWSPSIAGNVGRTPNWALDCAEDAALNVAEDTSVYLLPIMQRPLGYCPQWASYRLPPELRSFYDTFLLLLRPTGTRQG
jgi:hypothetical protein